MFCIASFVDLKDGLRGAVGLAVFSLALRREPKKEPIERDECPAVGVVGGFVSVAFPVPESPKNVARTEWPVGVGCASEVVATLKKV